MTSLKAAKHTETPMAAEPQQFRMSTEIQEGLPKQARLLCRTDRMIGVIQVIRKGGENNLHSHAHLDGMWTVLEGRARFYGEGDKPIAELGRYEGILIPRGFKYWFESAGDEVLVLHQVEASDIAMTSISDVMKDRVNHEPEKKSFEAVRKHSEGFDAPEGEAA